MFTFLRGTVAASTSELVALDVNGAGYAVSVPEPVRRKLAVGRETTLLTYCHIREDCFQIFGFLHDEERTLFLRLLAINKIGPKVALAVLSAMPLAEFARAILEHDVTAFGRVPGVGKATAQRIVLEMKTKLGQDAELSAILGEPEAAGAPEGDDVFEALVALGCSPQEAKRAADGARAELGEAASPEDLVRAALRRMARVG